MTVTVVCWTRPGDRSVEVKAAPARRVPSPSLLIPGATANWTDRARFAATSRYRRKLVVGSKFLRRR